MEIRIEGNTFVGNVNDAQAIESSNNEINRNYWDAASKVDVDGNGKSEIVFTADPVFPNFDECMFRNFSYFSKHQVLFFYKIC